MKKVFIPISCAECGEVFTPIKGHQEYCGGKCRKKAGKRRELLNIKNGSRFEGLNWDEKREIFKNKFIQKSRTVCKGCFWATDGVCVQIKCRSALKEGTQSPL